MARTFKDRVKTAANGVESVRQGTEHTLVGTLSVLVKAAGAVAGVIGILRGLDRDDGFAWFGFGRRRHPLRPVIVLGAGVVTGAVAGVLLAPMAGADLRQFLFGRSSPVQPQPAAAADTNERAADDTRPTNGSAAGTSADEGAGAARASGEVHNG
jgi:hypothetical protein